MRNKEIKSYSPNSFSALDEKSVVLQRNKFGDNNLKGNKIRGFLPRFFDETKNPITRILIFALFVNIGMIFYGGSVIETVGIGISILISTVVAVISEIGSDRAFAKISEENAGITVRCQRSFGIRNVPIGELVVGDIVLLSNGDSVPADGIIIEGNISVDQSALNGESAEADKTAYPGGNIGTPEDSYSLFRGSTVTKGAGKMHVCRVGENTLYGSMASELTNESEDSPLKVRLNVLSKQISRIGFCAALIVFSFTFFPKLITGGFSPRLLFDSAMLGISLLVVAVPEGLPMMITVVLASNMKKMSKSGVLVRRLVGIETAGSIDMLFCDKTGTLTKGKMDAVSFITPAGNTYRTFDSLPEAIKTPVCASMLLTSDAEFSVSGITGGNSTERAILKYVGKRNKGIVSNIRVLSRVPFCSQNKYSSAVISGALNTEVKKGAPEVIVPECNCVLQENGIISKTPPGRRISEITDEITNNAGRLISFSCKNGDSVVFLGMIHIRDVPRTEAKESVEVLRRAGVNICMVTGDSPKTALAVAKECRLDTAKRIITGNDLSKMSDSRLSEIIEDICIVARAVPSDKSRLVRIAKSKGHICGMTGDGVNDAPALHISDVGFAMGSGTECAKQAGDIVILDDNISSIEKAVLFGRTILSSIRKFIVFQLTTNLCAMGLCVIAPFLGIENPVTVTQMLWLNLIMDSLGGLAFAGEPALKMYMKMPPVSRSESIITSKMVLKIVFMTVSSLFCAVLFLSFPKIRAVFSGEAAFMCGFFCFFVFASVANAFNARCDRINMLSGLRRNRVFIYIMSAVTVSQIVIMRFGGYAFRCVPLSVYEMRLCFYIAFSVIPIEFVRRIFSKLNGK